MTDTINKRTCLFLQCTFLLFLRQLLHLFPFLLEPVFSSFFAKLKQGKLLGCIVHNHQCALFGKAFHLEDERFFRHGAVHQQAVVDEDGGGVSGKAFRQCDGIGFDEVAVFRFLLLQPHAHVDKDDDYENHGKGKDAVAYHKLFVGIQVVCHNCKKLNACANVMIKIERTDNLFNN